MASRRRIHLDTRGEHGRGVPDFAWFAGLISCNPVEQCQDFGGNRSQRLCTGYLNYVDGRATAKRSPEHAAGVVRVFRAANGYALPIVVDLRTSDPAYGGEHSRIFLTARFAPTL
jgi:hypothetical protein